MVSTFTPNIQLQEPAAGDQVGTWGTATVNPNMTLLDLVVGGIATIGLNNSNVVLTASQFQARNITFNSTLTGSVSITFPTSFVKDYLIANTCTGSSAFTITLQTTAGGQVICCPPGDAVQVYNDGTNIKFFNLDRIGAYWDYAGSSVPAWVSGCTIPPYLNCNGSTFSATTYPQLAVIIPGLTLPDARSRTRVALDQSAGRLSSAVIGFSPTTVGAAGGDQNLQQHNHTASVSDPGHLHGASPAYLNFGSGGTTNTVTGGSGSVIFQTTQTQSATTGISVSVNLTGSGEGANMQPTYMGGLTLIRAA